MKRIWMLCALLTGAAMLLGGCGEEEQLSAKPVLYLYPEQTTDVQVELLYDGELTCTYPVYENGWTVTAEPDGTLTDVRDGREYSYLFWEGTDTIAYDMSKGFVVKGEDTASFLQQKLEYLGLLPEEYNEFIVYWLPQMQDNPYNLITFQTECYTEHAVLHITPEPDSVLRIFMAWKPLAEPVMIGEQELTGFERKGFTAVEWGGARVE